MKKKIAIVGAGAWGTALAHFFGNKGYTVFLWCHEEAVARSINKDRINKFFLNTVLLPATVHASTDIQAVLSHDVDFVIEAVPLTYLKSVLEKINVAQALHYCWVLTSKGLDQKTGMHSLDSMHQLFGKKLRTIVLSGPSFASELVQSMPTACVAATVDRAAYNLFELYWQTDFTKLYFSDDLEGVLLCGALKNIVAILLGLLDGAGYGKNTQSFMLTLAYAEIKKLVILCGGKEATVHELAGFGDLFLTASTNVSKNRTYGYLVGQKKGLDEIGKQLSVVPEGVSTAAGLYVLCARLGNDMHQQFPLLCSVHKMLTNEFFIDVYIKNYFDEQIVF